MTLTSSAALGEHLTFGEFELAPAARGLWRSGVPVKLGSRALDILIVLASRPGEILSKDELTQLVWRGAAVDETALRVGISALRRALGDGGEQYITTVPGRGYCFVCDVATPIESSPEGAGRPALNPQRLPAQIGRIVGREAVVNALVEELGRRRLLSLVGPGGIGKTTVALAIAERLRGAYDVIAFVDLAPIENMRQMTAGVAAALGLNLRLQQDPVDEIIAAVNGRRVLLVCDNCEHLVDIAAAFVEDLIGRAPGLTVLTTTRELLRATGEWVHQLPALEAPPDCPDLPAEAVRSYPAVELFEERAAFALGGYEISDTDAPYVAEICRRLDGIALAIELAAGRLAGLGLQGLTGSLEDCFSILTHGRRTALPRHQTLRATLDWSYRLLSSEDQSALRRLAIFNGSFSLEDAADVVGDSGPLINSADRLESLHDKSLVVAAPSGPTVRYRLLETTRVYAREKLIEAGEEPLFGQRHAEHFRTVFDRAQAEWSRSQKVDWLQVYSADLGNLRAALDWAFSPRGDGNIGVALIAAAAPLWFHASLLDEGLARVELAIKWLKDQSNPDRRLMMQLYAISGFPQLRAISGIPSGAEAWRQVLSLAVDLGDVDYQLRALWALWIDCVNRGDASNSLDLADRFGALAPQSREPDDELIARRIRGKSLHFLGRFSESRREIEAMLERYERPHQGPELVRFQYDQRLVAQITLARNWWLEGFADLATTLVAEIVAEAETLDHTLTLAHILSDAACFIALWAGDLNLAVHYADMLRAHTTLHALDVWRTYADAFEGDILIRQGRVADGVSLLRRAIGSLSAGGFVLYNTAFGGVLAQGLLVCGESDDANEIITRCIDQCRRTGEAWCLPELMRTHALVLASYGRLSEALGVLEDGLTLASTQGALAWELKLASTLVGIDDTPGTRDTLRNVTSKIQEGFLTQDYLDAMARLDR